jgi:hypothetical protein
MKFNEYYKKEQLSENLKYHLDHDLSITESIFRLGSESFCDLVCEIRRLFLEGEIELSENDKFIVEKLKTGTKAVTKDGKKVVLDTPERISESGSKKKFRVWRDSGKKDDKGNIIAKKIEWGDPNMKVKNYDDKARKSFLARHRCHLKNDQDAPGWWACNVHKFAKVLNLSSDKPW